LRVRGASLVEGRKGIVTLKAGFVRINQEPDELEQCGGSVLLLELREERPVRKEEGQQEQRVAAGEQLWIVGTRRVQRGERDHLQYHAHQLLEAAFGEHAHQLGRPMMRECTVEAQTDRTLQVETRGRWAHGIQMQELLHAASLHKVHGELTMTHHLGQHAQDVQQRLTVLPQLLQTAIVA
jgi:hypothetical protein